MTKKQFLSELRKKLSGLPRADIEERLAFYGEMIDDRMDDGRSEAEAVADVGYVGVIAAQIRMETPSGGKKENGKSKKLGAWAIVLLVLGSPIWLSLAVAALAVLIAVYAVLFAVVVSLWSVFAALVGCGIGGAFSGTVLAFTGNALPGVAMVGAGLVSLGLSIFTFCVCCSLTTGAVKLCAAVVRGIRRLF
jgi:uncharacterized membrane protein